MLAQQQPAPALAAASESRPRSTGPGAAVPRRRRTLGRALRGTGFWVLVVLIVTWSLAPFGWQVVSSLQLDRDLTARTPSWFPDPLVLDHYVNIFVERRFQEYIVSSLVITLAATVVALLFSTLCAFALTRFPVPAKGAVMALILAISMFPQIAIVTPLYLVMNSLGLLDTYRGLSGVYIGLSVPLMVFVLYGHFRAIPREVDEAAAIDGAGRMRTLRSILVPVAAPGIVTAALLGFIANWNEFMLALSFTTTPEHQTIPVGIANFSEQFLVPWGDMSAASVVVTVPLVVLVVVFQRRIVDGISSGAVKE